MQNCKGRIKVLFKVGGFFVETFCIEKDSHIDAINVKIASNYNFLRLNKENKILLVHPLIELFAAVQLGSIQTGRVSVILRA